MNNKIYSGLEIKLESEGKSAGTLKEYTASIQKLEKYFPGKALSDLSDNELKEYAKYVQNKYSKHTYNNRIAAIRYVYKNVLNREIDLEKLPLQKIDKKA